MDAGEVGGRGDWMAGFGQPLLAVPLAQLGGQHPTLADFKTPPDHVGFQDRAVAGSGANAVHLFGDPDGYRRADYRATEAHPGGWFGDRGCEHEFQRIATARDRKAVVVNADDAPVRIEARKIKA